MVHVNLFDSGRGKQILNKMMRNTKQTLNIMEPLIMNKVRGSEIPRTNREHFRANLAWWPQRFSAGLLTLLPLPAAPSFGCCSLSSPPDETFYCAPGGFDLNEIHIHHKKVLCNNPRYVDVMETIPVFVSIGTDTFEPCCIA